MSSRNENNVDSYIIFQHQADCFDVPSTYGSLPAPTIFTGQRLRGTLSVSCRGAEPPTIDTVQIILEGIKLKFLYVNFGRLMGSLGKVESVINRADGLWYQIEKPVSSLSCFTS
jgi:hypothetical protein